MTSRDQVLCKLLAHLSPLHFSASVCAAISSLYSNPDMNSQLLTQSF